MKTPLWLLAVVVSGAVGFYFGLGQGAKTLGAIAAQNQVSEAIYHLRVSLDALEHNDVERANHLHEQNFKSALAQIGSYAPSVAYLPCSDKDREVMRAARNYVQAHPDILTGATQQFQSQGLAWCAQGGGT